MSIITLTQPQQERLRRLLHMEYTVTELAQELECKRRVIERAIEAGAPQRREHNRIFVVGDEFAVWYAALQPAEKTPLAADEAYCLHCRSPRKFTVEDVFPNSRGVERVAGRCLICGRRVNRLRGVAK